MTPARWEIRDLRFSYRVNGPELFHGLTHEFAPGKVTALTGASGRENQHCSTSWGYWCGRPKVELSATARI